VKFLPEIRPRNRFPQENLAMTTPKQLSAQNLSLDRNTLEVVYTPDAFEREDESDDREFYNSARIVSHLDDSALASVERLIGSLVIERNPVMLDLMASWDSHVPVQVSPSRLIGLGLNEGELQRNEALTERAIHDLNRKPELPFPDNTFDVVLNTVSVDYLTQPFSVFREVGRILKPGGLFLVIFSNRYFPPKVVRIWRQASDQERVLLVEDYFKAVGCFEPTRLWVAQGKPRPVDDRYADLGLPSDPVYALFAEKKGGPARAGLRPTPSVAQEAAYALDKQVVERRKEEIARTLCCPHCEQRLAKWAVPQTPFTEYDVEFLYVCFNDRCPYLMRGWEAMTGQGNLGFSHRFMYMRERDACGSLPVHSLKALRASIVEE
jgi:SAM-dependent methyltransferase